MTHRVLVVDDDLWLLHSIAHVLTKHGYDVKTAPNGQDAYEKAVLWKPDLIVTDVMMPKMSGWQLVRTLRALADLPHIPVIFLSAYDDRLQGGARLDADDYLPKPFSLDEVAQRVSIALRKHAMVTDEPAAPRADPSGVHGTLDQLALSSLLVIAEMERKTGILVLHRGAAAARVAIHMGRVVSAQLDHPKLKGPAAVYELLSWPDGFFDFTLGDVDATDEMHGMLTQHLLMESARLIDEAAAGKK